jgi:hypothetical protein
LNGFSIEFDPIDFKGRLNQIDVIKHATPAAKQGRKVQGLLEV